MKTNAIVRNAKWIIICKIVQSLLQFVVGMLCARYLGPSNYGLISYAGSITAFAIPFVMLGLNTTLVQELIDHPDSEGEIMGTSILMSVVSGLVCIILVGLTVSVVNRNEKDTLIVCLLYSISLIFTAIELIQYWFHSKLKSKYPSMMMVFAYVTVSAYKIFLLVTQKNIYWFAVVHSIEYGIIGIALILIYYRESPQRLTFSLHCARKLLSKSRHYILAALMVKIFQNTDHIMLKIMAGDAENGFYSAAVTCITICQFVYIAIIDSTRPSVLSQKKAGSPEWERTLSKLYSVIVYLALAQSVVFTVFAELIIYLTYGHNYMNAVPVLRILVWYEAFSCIGVIRNIWILASEKHSILWKINFTGIIVNIVINAVLIPKIGARGAAIASLATQIMTNFVLGFIYKPLYEHNRILMKGLNPGLLLQTVKSILNKTR